MSVLSKMFGGGQKVESVPVEAEKTEEEIALEAQQGIARKRRRDRLRTGYNSTLLTTSDSSGKTLLGG